MTSGVVVIRLLALGVSEGVPVGWAEYMVMYEVERMCVAGIAVAGRALVGGSWTFATLNSAVVCGRTEKYDWCVFCS